MLNVETYDAAEAAAAHKFSNRILQAFYPELFVGVGYPIRVRRDEELWRYIDVMHETKTHYNLEKLLFGMTLDEFELFKNITRIVDKYANNYFNIRAHPTAALLRAFHALRLIKSVTGSNRPTVLEVGPGCGYLAMLLIMEGYPYVGTDVTQAFYVYQNHMLSQIADNLCELVTSNDDILSIEQPKAGTAVHIPWWKWVTMTPNNVKLSTGIITCNHALCEMSENSVGYLAAIAHQTLSNSPCHRAIVFENWGYGLRNSVRNVSETFAKHGLFLCHNEYAASAMALGADIDLWRGGSSLLQHKIRSQSGKEKEASRKNSIAKHAIEKLSKAPVARFATKVFEAIRSQAPIEVVTGPNGPYPLSEQITNGLRAFISKATVHETELADFLSFHFGGNVPEGQDETFLRIIETYE